jgi:hypothetical protein
MSDAREPRGEGRTQRAPGPQTPTPAPEDEPSFKLDKEIALKYDPATLSRHIMRDAGRGESLDLNTRARMESRLGGDFSNVRIVRGPLAEEITSRYRADAVTVGGTELILVREGWQSNFQSAEGAALLAHELTHVQQQQRGLHFAHSGEGAEHSDIEQEAYSVQALTRAEEQGRNLADESTKRAALAEKKIWHEVKKQARKMLKNEEESKEIRDGAANIQSNTQAT